jgi:integrase
VTAHDLRRTFGSWLAQRGVSTKAIGELLGHAPGSRMADLTYSVLTDDALRAAVDKLPSARNVEVLAAKEKK